ncbi:MAG TPA: flagellar basal-body rod protein FlgG [Actinobacteria bacterium]|nr:flagellar basal-body rod protein FlgG [Actinomycetota bacterium]
MIRSLWISASGLQTQQMSIDTIGNNVSNINTTGFKRVISEFQDLDYKMTDQIGSFLPEGMGLNGGIQIGCGVGLMDTRQIFEQGSIENTGNQFDLAIEGNGFFRVKLADGSHGYTRDGSFMVDGATGRLTTTSGYYLEPPITIPDGATSISISEKGMVSAILEGESASQEIGQINLFKFTNPAGLQRMGDSLFAETVVSGDVTQNTPSADGFGTLCQGFLEMSNVNLADEMAKLLTASRAYQLNARAIKNADTMLSIANQIFRG